MKNFSYIHVEKLKVWGRGILTNKQYKANKYKRHWGVQGCWEHDMRLIGTANADPLRTESNGIACQETLWEIQAAKKETLESLGAARPTFITEKAQKFLEEKGIKPREDQVKVAMLLCAASPEFLRDGDTQNPLNKKKVLLWAKTTVQFLQQMYKDCLLACIIHRDELNPHLTAYIVPALEADLKKRGPKTQKPSIPTRKWTLNASKLFTPDPCTFTTLPDGKIQKVRQGRGTCSLLQDLYAQALQESGLAIRRGVRRAPHQTGLPHETTKSRWEALSAPAADVDQIPDHQLREWAKKIAIQAENARRLLQEKTHYQEIASHALNRIRKAAQLLRKLKREKNTLKKKLQKAPEPPSLEKILVELTGLPVKQTLQGRLLTLPSNQKILLERNNTFQLLNPQNQKEEGLDLQDSTAVAAIIHITHWKEREALAWLAQTFGPSEAGRILANPISSNPNYKKEFLEALSRHEETQWPLVSKTLVEKFGLDPNLLEKLKENRWIGANQFGHLTLGKILFSSGQKPIPTGKFIQDLTIVNGFRHETGTEGVTFLSTPNAEKTILCTQPLEALALKHLYPQKSILLVGENPHEETSNIIDQRRHQHPLEIAEVLQPTQKIKEWMQENLRKGAQLLPLPLGVQSFLQAHLQPRKTDIPTLEFVLDDPAPSQDVDQKKT